MALPTSPGALCELGQGVVGAHAPKHQAPPPTDHVIRVAGDQEEAGLGPSRHGVLQEGAVPDPSHHGDDHVVQGAVPDPSEHDHEVDHVMQEEVVVPDPNSHGSAHVTLKEAGLAPSDPGGHVDREVVAPPSENVPEKEAEEGARADHVIQQGAPMTPPPQVLGEEVEADHDSTDHGDLPSARVAVALPPTSRAEGGGPSPSSPQLRRPVLEEVEVV